MSTSQYPGSSSSNVSSGTPLIEVAAARIEMHDVAVAEGFSVRLTGPRVVIVGDPTPLFAPLFGTGPVTRGWFKVMGNDLASMRPSLGLAPLDPPLPSSWTPIEYVVWSAKLAGMSSGDALVAALHWCERVGLGNSARTKLEALAAVPRRLTMLAQAAVASPKLLVVDNPLWRLTTTEAQHVLAAMGQLGGEGGCTNVIVSTTRFEPGSPGDILARGADELVLIVDGEVIEQGSPSELAAAHPSEAQAPANQGHDMSANTSSTTTSTPPQASPSPPADPSAELSTGATESADLPVTPVTPATPAPHVAPVVMPEGSTDHPPHAPTENTTGENAQIEHNGNVDGPGTHGSTRIRDTTGQE